MRYLIFSKLIYERTCITVLLYNCIIYITLLFVLLYYCITCITVLLVLHYYLYYCITFITILLVLLDLATHTSNKEISHIFKNEIWTDLYYCITYITVLLVLLYYLYYYIVSSCENPPKCQRWHILLNLATRGCPWVKFKFKYASTLSEGHLSQRWRIWDLMEPHNNFFQKKYICLNPTTLPGKLKIKKKESTYILVCHERLRVQFIRTL